jgi:hypothetical protein
MSEKPELLQLLTCEKLIFEQGSGNVSLINCFHTRTVEAISADASPFVIYGTLTGGYGVFTIQMRIAHVETGDDVHQQSLPMLFTDRLRLSNLLCRVNKLRFPSEGRYEVTAHIDGGLLALTTLNVRVRK